MAKTANSKKKREFTEEFKREVVREAANQPKGQVAAYLTSKGITPSHYYQWRSAFELKDSKQANGSSPVASQHTVDAPRDVTTDQRLMLLEEENKRLKTTLTQIEQLFDIQKTLNELIKGEKG